MIRLLLVLLLLLGPQARARDDLSGLGVTPAQVMAQPVTVTSMRPGYTWRDLQAALFGEPLFIIRHHAGPKKRRTP